MNIEEARKVFWLKNNHRPLGELLDEGYLTKDRLEWAARWDYNPNLQQASKLILEALNHDSAIANGKKPSEAPNTKRRETGLDVGISLDKARLVSWPFAPHRGKPLGTLIDSKMLSLKDLAYAIENAWDEKVRKAATVFALMRLNQIVKEPVPSAGFVHVVSGGRSFAQRRETFFTLLQGAFMGFLITLLAFWLAKSFRGVGTPNPSAKSLSEFLSMPGGPLALVIVVVSVIFVGWLASFVTDQINKRLDGQIEQYRRGQEGEDHIIQSVVQALDGNWHLFRNILIPGKKKADLDLVLVGPPGIWVLEVKNFNGEYRNIGEKWEYRRGKNWRPASKNPSKQVSKNMYRLKDFLKADHLHVFVNHAVVWANPESRLYVENPSVAVWRYDRLPDELGNIWQGEKLSEVERNKIVEKLTKLCEEQKDKN